MVSIKLRDLQPLLGYLNENETETCNTNTKSGFFENIVVIAFVFAQFVLVSKLGTSHKNSS